MDVFTVVSCDILNLQGDNWVCDKFDNLETMTE